MRKSVLVTLAVALGAAVFAYSQAAAPPAAPQQAPAAAQAGAPAVDPAVAAANAAKRQQLQQQMQPLQQEIQSLQQRLRAGYASDLSPAQIQQRLQQLQQQLEPLQQQLQQLGPAPGFGAGGRGGFGAGRGAGRGGPINPPADATPEQLRQAIQQLNDQAQQLRAAQAGPPRAPAPPPCVPVNPNATPEAKELLKKLCDVTGKGILTGQHNFPNQRNLDAEAIHEATGKYPAIWGTDFGFLDGEDKDAITHRNLLIEEAKRQYAAGSIIYFCWHMLRPTEDEPGRADPNGGTSESWRGSVQASLTDDQWLELITSDSPLHQRWEKYMDTAAGYLKQLQDAHIPVLWRPMHENNGSFFWWGGRPGQYGTAMLFREVYNRMVNVHHLNNLVWVWNQNGPAPGAQFYNFYPGPQYADVVSYDNYSTLDDRYYHEILTIANGKPIGLGEVGSIPSPETLKAQPKWAFYMTWGGMAGAGRGAAGAPASGGRGAAGAPGATAAPGGRGGRGGVSIQTAYENPYLLKRGDPIPTEAPAAPAPATSAPAR